MRDYLPLFGRMGLSLIFILMGFEKLLDFDNYLLELEAMSIEFAVILLPISIFVELIGGFLILLGYYTKYASLVLAIYMIPVTILFFPIWQDIEYFHEFLKNIAISGGLLILSFHGSGPKSLDLQ